jgi:hypothetical protein
LSRLARETVSESRRVAARVPEVQRRNAELVEELLEIEGEKQQLGDALLRHGELSAHLSDVEGLLAKAIAQRSERVAAMDFHDEDSFAAFINEATALKKL